MIMSGEHMGEWQPGEPRVSTLVFIGKNLNRAELETSFRACMEKAPSSAASSPAPLGVVIEGGKEAEIKEAAKASRAAQSRTTKVIQAEAVAALDKRTGATKGQTKKSGR